MQILRPEDRKRRRLAYWLVMGGGGPRGLISNGILSAPLTLTRAQAAGVEATGLTAAGWQTYGANVPRFVLPNGGLLIGGQRSNGVRNPRAEGGVVGNPGTMPTNWSQTGPGLSREIVGIGVEGGIPYIDLRIFGTSTSTFYTFTGDAISAHTSAANGQAWTASIFARLISGTVRTTRAHFRQQDSGGVDLGDVIANLTVPTTGALGACRMVGTATLTNASTARLFSFFQVLFSSGTVIDDTWRLGFPQLELGAFASTPILPPVGTPGASTRGTDIVTAPLSALGIPASGACTVLWRGAFDATNIGTQQTVAAIDDGSANRHEIRLSGSGLPEIIRVTAGTPVSQTFGGPAPTPGAIVRAGISIDGTGRLAGVVAGYNSGAALNVTGGPTSGLTTFRLGTSQTGAAREMWGTTERLQVLPRVVSDAELAALVAAF